MASNLVLSVASLGLTLASVLAAPLGWIYFFLFIIGAARTFLWPASAAFVTGLVPRPQLARAITFNSGMFQISSVAGPVAFGLFIALTPQAQSNHTAWSVYAFNTFAALLCATLVFFIKHEHTVKTAEPVSARSLLEGFRFVYQNKIILGVITLDLFAVLLGGAVTLLPIFAKDIFARGASGLSWLRDAMAIGAVACAFVVAHRPPLQKAGKTMLWSVAIFGLATILFGLANLNCLGRWLAWPNAVWFWCAFAMLVLAGVVDQISVVVRQTLVQILTPDEKRGRVSAVNSLFIGTSNELGGIPFRPRCLVLHHPDLVGQPGSDRRNHLRCWSLAALAPSWSFSPWPGSGPKFAAMGNWPDRANPCSRPGIAGRSRICRSRQSFSAGYGWCFPAAEKI